MEERVEIRVLGNNGRGRTFVAEHANQDWERVDHPGKVWVFDCLNARSVEHFDHALRCRNVRVRPPVLPMLGVDVGE